MAQRCSVCQQEFTCGTSEGQQACWCSSFPFIMPAEFNQACRCPSCLAKAIADRIEASLEEKGSDQMVEIASQYKNNNELVDGIDYTMEEGYMVFSKWYHLKRGSCCGNGCRNCPYGK